MRPQRHTLLGLACLVLLTGFGCGIIGAVANPHGLDGVAYWAAATTTAVATETRFLGTTTPVLVTPVPAQLTTTPFWTTVTATPIVPPETATPADVNKQQISKSAIVEAAIRIAYAEF